MSDLDPAVLADLDPDHAPLFGEKEPPTKHRVREHERTLPPRPRPEDDPDQITLADFVPGWPEALPPQPRVVTVRPHVRRNPRPKEITMSHDRHRGGPPLYDDGEGGKTFRPPDPEVDAATCLPPETRTDVTAMKDAIAETARPEFGGVAQARNSDPATSHGAAAVATHSLRRRMTEVLRVFKAQDFTARAVGDEAEGYTDDELVRRLDRLDVKGSPSGFRTARKDLERLGLVWPRLTAEDEPWTRPTRLGNEAVVFILTEAGRAFILP